MKKILTLLLLSVSIPTSAQIDPFSKADSLLVKGHYKLALAHLKSIDTLRGMKNYKIGGIYASIDDFKNAITYYTKSLEFKENFKVQRALASAYYRIKKYKEAIIIYEAILEKDTENLIIQFQLGKLYMATNALKKASKTIKMLSLKDPQNPNYQYQLGLIAARKSNRNGMLTHFLNAYEIDTTHIKSVYQLAKRFSVLRKRDSSRLFTDKGLALNPLHLNLNKLKINSLFRNKKYQKSIERLRLLDSLDPNQLYTQKMLGRSYFGLDSLDLAVVYFKKAQEIDQDDFNIPLNLGHIYAAKKEHNKASMYYIRALSTGKKDRSEAYYGSGMQYVALQQPKIAIAMFKKALIENGGKYKIHYQLALTSDSYYKDKKIAYDLYDNYLMRFDDKDEDLTKFVSARMKAIKTSLFMSGVEVK